MGQSKTYDPKLIVVTFQGVPLTGFAAGSFLKATRKEASFKTVVGADGESSRSRSRDRSGEVTLTLRATSPTNDTLTTWWRLDDRGLPGGRGPLQVKDLNGTTVVMAQDAWIEKSAPVDRAKEEGTAEWTFGTGDIDIRPGGSYI